MPTIIWSYGVIPLRSMSEAEAQAEYGSLIMPPRGKPPERVPMQLENVKDVVLVSTSSEQNTAQTMSKDTPAGPEISNGARIRPWEPARTTSDIGVAVKHKEGWFRTDGAVVRTAAKQKRLAGRGN